MDYEYFLEKVRAAFIDRYGSGGEQVLFYPDGWIGSGSVADHEFIQSTNHFYQKGDSNCLNGDYIVLQENKEFIRNMCRFSVEVLFEKYQREGWENVWKIVDENLRFRNKCHLRDIFNENVTYEMVKSHLIIRPINYSDNRFELRHAYYHTIGDIALVLYAIVYADDENITTAKVPKEYFEIWGVNADYAFDQALINTYVTRPPRIYFTHQECVEPCYEAGAFMDFDADYHINTPFTVPTITTIPQTNGSIAIFYPDVQKKLASVMGGSYYIVFTSVHEARLHLIGTIDPREALKNLNAVNQMFAPEDVLTRKLFLYNDDTDKLSVVDI